MSLNENISDFIQSDSAKTFVPPEGVQNAAKKVLEWREKHGKEVKGGTAIGWRRASQLASGKPVSLDVIRRMYSFFARHEGFIEAAKKKPEAKTKPWTLNAITASYLWGHDAGKSWCRKIWESQKNK